MLFGVTLTYTVNCQQSRHAHKLDWNKTSRRCSGKRS